MIYLLEAGQTILDYLDSERIVGFYLNEDRKQIKIREECDRHFSVEITKGQMHRLIQELQELHANMVD